MTTVPGPSDVSKSPIASLLPTKTTQSQSDNNIEIKKPSFVSAYQRWRPSYHLQAPSGWMNDPCAPTFDSTTGLYHVSFQSSLDLKNHDWDNIAWRSAISPDLVSWAVDSGPALSPDAPYDCKGAFTGCMLPCQDGVLTCVYTSVSALPIHHTLPHPKGCESLSMARSIDGGKTWEKFAGNPILPSEPVEIDVTGWRDPYVSSWPSMASFLDLPADRTLFGIISGGIRNVTPTTFLYTIDSTDPTKWRYVGPLVDLGHNKRPSRWSGDLGKNWEVTNFLTLEDEKDPSIKKNFLIMGTEGCISNPQDLPNSESSENAGSGPARPIRGQLWMSGSLKRGQNSCVATYSPVQMGFDFGGHLDHGCFYAANSFFDPKTSKNIVWGWITEDDLCDELRHRQGWSGMLSLPREIHLQTLENVLFAWRSELTEITCIECERDARGASTVKTLVSEPVQSVVEVLRQVASIRHAKLPLSLLPLNGHDLAFASDDVRTRAWELDCEFKVSRHCKTIGVQLVHSQDFSRTTTLSFDPPAETFTIDRPSFPSTDSHVWVNSKPETAPHTLYTTQNITSGLEQTEPLRIHAWRDNSVLEVFVNGRTAISTRLYAAEETFGIRFFVDEAPITEADSSTFTSSALIQAILWDGIGVPRSETIGLDAVG